MAEKSPSPEMQNTAFGVCILIPPPRAMLFENVCTMRISWEHVLSSKVKTARMVLPHRVEMSAPPLLSVLGAQQETAVEYELQALHIRCTIPFLAKFRVLKLFDVFHVV